MKRTTSGGSGLRACRVFFGILVLFAPFPKSSAAAAPETPQMVPVLMWHGLDESWPADPPYDPVDFATQIRWLASRGFRTISPDDLVDWIESGTRLPERPVVLTFDDNHISLYRIAWPLLGGLGMQGTDFVITRHAGTGHPRVVQWPELGEMERSGVFRCESHTIDHPDLTQLADADLLREILFSRTRIESAIPGKKCRFLAYPFGRYDEHVIAALQRAGYRGAFAIELDWNTRETDPYALRRFYINPSYDLYDLCRMVDIPIGTPTEQPRPGDLIVDNLSPSFLTTGTWHAGQNPRGVFGPDYVYAPPGCEGATAVWPFRVWTAGIYDIYLSFPDDPSNARHARVSVHDAVRPSTWTIDQRAPYQGDWVKIQRCLLTPEILSTVEIVQSEEGRVVADAIFVRLVEPFRTRLAFEEDTLELTWPSLPGILFSVMESDGVSGIWIETLSRPGRLGEDTAAVPSSRRIRLFRVEARVGD